jgi:hypothetical protein
MPTLSSNGEALETGKMSGSRELPRGCSAEVSCLHGVNSLKEEDRVERQSSGFTPYVRTEIRRSDRVDSLCIVGQFFLSCSPKLGPRK